MAQAQSRNAFFIDIRTSRPVSNSVWQVQPEHYMTVTMLHHELMFALREWMPGRLLYCAYCGTWRTLCNAHEESTPLFTSDLHFPKLLTADRKPYVCLTCHIKGPSRLHQLGPAYQIPLLEECLSRS